MAGGRSGSFADLNNSDFGMSSKSFSGRDLFPGPGESDWNEPVSPMLTMCLISFAAAAPRTRHSFGGKSLNEDGGKQFGLSECGFPLERAVL